MRTDNSILLTLFNIARVGIDAICAKYNITLNCNSAAVIKDSIWRTFVDNESHFFYWAYIAYFLVYFYLCFYTCCLKA